MSAGVVVRESERAACGALLDTANLLRVDLCLYVLVGMDQDFTSHWARCRSLIQSTLLLASVVTVLRRWH